MSTEHTIICGGINATGIPKYGELMPLSLWPGGGDDDRITLRIEDLHEELCQTVPVQFHDLLEIAAYVYSADHLAKRGGKDVDCFGTHWRRHFHFHIPVRMLDFWRMPAVTGALRELLEFLSEDSYDFTFYQAIEPPRIQLYLGLDEKGAIKFDAERVMLFSGGLDSLSGAIEEAIVQRRRVVLVNHRSTDKFSVTHRELVRVLTDKAGASTLKQLRVRISKKGIEAREHTQRARSFLFGSVGATVAMMLGQRSIRFYENGVVSLNLPVCGQVVGSRATRTTHPRVLAGMQRLLTLVAQEPFKVDNPFLWETKGEVVGRIIRNDCGPMIALSRSCAHVWETSNANNHCGTCSQCIDRRFGILAAKAEAHDPEDHYKVNIFTESRPKEEDKIMGAMYLERANQVSQMQDTAEFIDAFPEVLRALKHLDSLDAGRGAARIMALYKRHAAEVKGGIVEMMRRHLMEINDRTLPADCLLRTVYETRTPTAMPAGPVNGERAHAAEAKKETEGGDRYIFQNIGSHFEVVYDGGGKFSIPNTLGTKYIDHLLHNPNKVIRARDLESAVQANKETARGDETEQVHLDGQAKWEAEQEFKDLMADLELAKENDDQVAVERLEGEIEALKTAQKNQGGMTADSGERARNNVRKAITAVIQRLHKGNRQQKTFGTHLGQCISLGYEVMYTQPQGGVWQ
ncbi:MAG: 7-cyano-7-deazaguanine synthase [Verrucomicrobiota bacterium]